MVFGHYGSARDEPAPPYRHEYSIEAGCIRQQLQRRSALPGDDAVVVVGMNYDGAGLCNHVGETGLPGGQARSAGHDFSALPGHGLLLDPRGIVRNHDPRGNAPAAGRQGDRGAVIARRMRCYAASGFLLRQRPDGVHRPPSLEGTNTLQVFTFQKNPAADKLVKGRTMKNRRPVDPTGDGSCRSPDIGGCGRLPPGRQLRVPHGSRNSSRR